MDLELANNIKYKIEVITDLQREVIRGEEAKKQIANKERELKQLMNEYLNNNNGDKDE